MSRLGELIAKLCPAGVVFYKISEVAYVSRGKRVTKKDLIDGGDYPVFQNSLTPLGYYDKANYKAGTTFAICAGAAGEIGYSETDYWGADDCFSIVCSENLIDRFVYHFLRSKQEYIKGNVRKASIPRLSHSVIDNMKIPVPPLEVQREIVRILDNFTELTSELTSELTAELTARKKQYEYYRELLLSSPKDGVIKKLGNISEFRRGSFPQPYGNPKWYDGEGAMPFVQVADIDDNMLLVKDTKRKISKVAQPKSVFAPRGSVIISLQGSIGRIAITQYDAYIDRTVAIFRNINSDVVKKYFVYQLQRIFAIKEKTARGSTIKTITKEEFNEFPIVIPSIQTQQIIVAKLDSYSDLCQNISYGLPAEIEARQKQYEYYRDKLLTFKEA